MLVSLHRFISFYTQTISSPLFVCSVNEFCISFGMYELANRIAERSHLKSSINSGALFVGARNKTKQFKRILITREVETTRINYQAAVLYKFERYRSPIWAKVSSDGWGWNICELKNIKKKMYVLYKYYTTHLCSVGRRDKNIFVGVTDGSHQ